MSVCSEEKHAAFLLQTTYTSQLHNYRQISNKWTSVRVCEFIFSLMVTYNQGTIIVKWVSVSSYNLCFTIRNTIKG